MECWHNGNKKEAAEDGWPPKGCSPSLALLKVQDISPALRLAGTGRPPRGMSKARPYPLGTTLVPSAMPAHGQEAIRRDQARSTGGNSPLHSPLEATRGVFIRPRKKLPQLGLKDLLQTARTAGRACLEILNV